MSILELLLEYLLMFKMVRYLMRFIGLTLLLLILLGSILKCISFSKQKTNRWIHGKEYHRELRKQEALENLSSSTSHNWRKRLPKKGQTHDHIMSELSDDISNPAAWEQRYSDIDSENLALISEAYSMFVHTRLVHSDTPPSITRFGEEVVQWAADLFVGEDGHERKNQICGSMTSGGAESVFLALKSARDFMKMKKGIKNPEMIIPYSAISAYEKAAAYLKVKVIRVPITREFEACVETMRVSVNKNTIMIVGSAPCFPYGIIDPIKELAELALRSRICFHVDLCHGGLALPFARKLARCRLPSVDFSVEGITSLSADLDKNGLAPGGISIVLFKNHEIVMHESAGGHGTFPTISNISEGLVAGTWVSVQSLGEAGYKKITKEVMDTTAQLKKGIEKMRDIFIIGKPEMTIIAFSSNSVVLQEVCEDMKFRGWHLNLFQRPNIAHIFVTRQHVMAVEKFLIALRECVENCKPKIG